MKIKHKVLILTSAIFLLFASAQVSASVVVVGTRVIYPKDQREVTVRLSNDGASPALVQAWIDKGNQNESPESIEVPFILTPAMFRLDPKKGQALRLIYTKEPLPEDKESIFWLNVLEIPPQSSDGGANKLQLAIRTRIKLFFRPPGLAGDSAIAPEQLNWKVTTGSSRGEYALKATNPTPYVINLGMVELKSHDKIFKSVSGFIKPGESQIFPVRGLSELPDKNSVVEYTSINDWGGAKQNIRELEGGAGS
jgi:chaperone protein EcpD